MFFWNIFESIKSYNVLRPFSRRPFHACSGTVKLLTKFIIVRKLWDLVFFTVLAGRARG